MTDRPIDGDPLPDDVVPDDPTAAPPADPPVAAGAATATEAPETPPEAPAATATPPDAPAAPTDPPDADGVSIDAEALAASEAAAADRADTAAAVALVMASARAKAEAAATAAAVAVPDPSLADAAGVQRRSRRAAIRGTLAMLARGVLVLALFVGGIALGYAAFQRSDQVASTAPVVDPAVDGAEAPAVVQEFVTALAGGDADSLRSSLQAEPHARLTSEFRRFDIQSISAVDTLGTHVDGPRSATEVVMQGTTTGGQPISINLIILTDGNTIEGFR